MVLAGPGSAAATTLVGGGQVIEAIGSDAGDSISVANDASGQNVLISDPAGTDIGNLDLGCTDLGNTVSCPVGANYATYVIPGGGDDVIDLGGASGAMLNPHAIVTESDGNDTEYGSAGPDSMRGGVGNDRLVGFAGKDILFGEAGEDTILARDGGPDSLVCNVNPPLEDTVEFDTVDELVHCRAPVVGVTLRKSFVLPRPRRTRVKKLELGQLPADSIVTVTCQASGGQPIRGCPFTSKTLTPNPGSLELGSLFKKPLRVGTSIGIEVFAPSSLGRSYLLTTRAERRPVRLDQCLMSGPTPNPIPAPCP
jgi:RTX calcium-binding nonapeptide repeat (4 copies)